MRNLSKLGKRESSTGLALRLLDERVHGANIVETGCVRQADDWSGAGMSTLIFGEWASSHGAHLWTVDNDRDHLATARRLTRQHREAIEYVLSDSVSFLKSGLSQDIDLLYLDSLDYPYGELLDLYGGKVNLDLAVATLAGLTEAQVVERHHDLIFASQRHAAKEALAALPYLTERAIVLIDDAGLPGGGKARLARAVLEAYDFRCWADGYQTLWARP